MRLDKCLGCMEDYQGYPCPNCGFDPNKEQGSEYILPPQTILAGKYLVGRMLGQGGFGITYIGWDLALERKVAIKEYYPSGQVSRQPGTRQLTWYTGENARAAQQSGMEMFLKEARKMVRVDAISGVVRVLDLFRENETAYIVMDFVEGETLKNRLKKTGPMDWAQAKDIFLPAIRAMEEVHKAGLIHRDLSPDNLMLTPTGDVKILDLGAAKDLNVNTGASSMQVAKSGFSPLEQYTQRGGSGPWTDVYSMAATIYYTLTGKIPPTAIDRMENDAICWTQPRLDTLPRAALAALKKAMVVSAQKRTQSMEELKKGLFEKGAEPEIHPKPAPTPKPKPKPKSAPEMKPELKPNPEPAPKKPGKVVWVAAAAAAVILGGVLWGMVLKPGSDYKKAQALMDAGQYEEAEAAFEALGDYRDSTEQLQEAQKASAYQQAQSLADTGQFDKAVSAFDALGNYRDSAEQVRLLPTYQRADTLMKFGQYPGAAIVFSKLGDYRDSAQRAGAARGMRQVNAISAGTFHTVGLRSNGTVVAVGNSDDGQRKTGGWSDIVSVSAGSGHTIGLRNDGTVVAVGENERGQCDVGGWTDITAVYAGKNTTVGLRNDGTVITAGNRYDTSDWTDIVAVSAAYHAVGLRSDGTVVAVGPNGDGECEVSGWSDIVAVAAGVDHTVGLRSDGTVVAVGSNKYGQCEVSGWTDIVAVAAGYKHTVGLRSDGTVVAVGDEQDGQCNVSDWSDIIAISTGWEHTAGLRSDGTVVAVGSNVFDQCNVDTWTDIRIPY